MVSFTCFGIQDYSPVFGAVFSQTPYSLFAEASEFTYLSGILGTTLKQLFSCLLLYISLVSLVP